MSRKLRNITVLALIPVLVCLLCIPAFAASTWYDSEDYDNGSQFIEADANISRYATSGTITSLETGNYLYVGATYKYYPSGGASLVTETESAASYRYYAQVGFSNSSIHTMYNATYTFQADVYTSAGVDYYRPYAAIVTY